MKNVRLKVLLASCLTMLGCHEEPQYGVSLASCGDGVSCPNGLDCVEGLCKRPVESGESCASSDSYCVSGTCESGICMDNNMGIACDPVTNPCPDGKICTANGCLNPADVGGSCAVDDVCKRGKCVNHVCSVTVKAGQACNNNERLCEDGYKCHEEICMKPAGEGDDCRSSVVYCETGYCVQGVCSREAEDENCQDTDGDTISDEYDRCDVDTDGDGSVNCLDLDSDNDTIPDALEAGADPCQQPVNSDEYVSFDSEYDFLDLDSDANGIPDAVEGIRYVVKTPEPTEENPNPSPVLVMEYADTDGDTILDSAELDNDNDGAWDEKEIYGYAHKDYEHLGNTPPRAADCNGDTLPDEMGTLEQPFDCDADTLPDYLDADSDNDGVLDLYEGEQDSDYDGYLNRYEQDSDNDGLTDNEELGEDGKPKKSISDAGYDFMNPDIDDDGLLDGSEPHCTITLTCGANQAACSQKCVDIMNDAKNCGGCGISCQATSSCVNGTCVAQCTDPMIACGETCINPAEDVKNCGACGTVCGANQVCSAEGCVDVTDLTCEDGKTACWGKCEDFMNDAKNCGACGNACDSGLSCLEGVCTLVCADPALTACNNTACVDLTQDVKNCGACGTVCGTNQVCAAEGCVDVTDLTCEDGKTACWGKCEDLQNDAKNCGTCGNVCDKDLSCIEGVCTSTKQPDNIVYVDARLVGDADEDGFGDNSEYIAATYKGVDPALYICDAAKGVVGDADTGVEGAFNFFFELPYGGEEQRDTLNFKPSVSKLDVIFNVDTTNSMGVEVANLKSKINAKLEDDGIVAQIRQRVSDSAIGVSRFDDFPTRATKDSEYDYLVGNSVEDGYGKATANDTPFQLLGQPETNSTTIQTNVNKLGLHHGGDFPESGYEALWQLVMGDDKTKPQANWRKYLDYSVFSAGSIVYTPVKTGRWGGGQFRDASLPVVVHITDTTSHDNACNCPADTTLSQATLNAFCSGKNTTCKPYDPIYVENAHYSAEVHKAYQDKGARIISVYRQNGTQLQQLVDTSNATQAVVPVCAFQTETGWTCGDNKCCTRSDTNGNPLAVDPVDDKCVLSYGISKGDHLSKTLVDGVDALVKYATSEVAAIVHGEPMEGYDHDTSCFIKGVVAFDNVDEAGNKVLNRKGEEITGYVAPTLEPEKSCNPKAQPMAFDGSTYNNGYANFAIGTSSTAKAGAQLNFIVKAQNDTCAKPKEQAQVFEASIDIVDPKTGMIFGTQKVSIAVPGVKAGQVN